MKTYRVGLLLDGTDQPGWIHDMAEWLARSQDCDLAALLVMEKPFPNRAWAPRRCSAPCRGWSRACCLRGSGRCWRAATCARACLHPFPF